MIPFNLPHNPKPSPAIRKPNPLRASGPYYHICYVRCAISNLRPPNCFYNMSPVHPRFLFSPTARARASFASYSSAFSTSLKRSPFLFSSPDSFRSPRLARLSYVCRDDKFHSTNRDVSQHCLFPQGRVIINSLPRARAPSILSSFPLTISLSVDYEREREKGRDMQHTLVCCALEFQLEFRVSEVERSLHVSRVSRVEYR